MERKQILLINDVAGNSKVGMGAMIPVLSYLGYPTFNLPTALVSNTFDYGRFAIQDTTDFIRQTLLVWKELGFGYDAICTGCMLSQEQVHLVADYCREQRQHGTLVFVDPVMGDGGHLYNGMTMRHVELMRKMVNVADLTFPNYTEATLLTGMEYREEGISWDEAKELIDRLRKLGARSVLVTSCRCEGSNSVVGYNADDDDYFRLEYEEIPGLFHGTGDLFSAILIGKLFSGKPLRESTRYTMDIVYRLISLNRDMPDKNRGILIEQFLNILDE
jgi:pyridoxine kinase